MAVCTKLVTSIMRLNIHIRTRVRTDLENLESLEKYLNLKISFQGHEKGLEINCRTWKSLDFNSGDECSHIRKFVRFTKPSNAILTVRVMPHPFATPNYYVTGICVRYSHVFSALWRAVVDLMCGSISRKLATNMYIVACVQGSWHTTEAQQIFGTISFCARRYVQTC